MDKYYFKDTDFIGFSFNGGHSADYGILRISDGDRYEETLVPDLSDEAEEIPGGDGAYYVGETLKEKTFKIDFAYDCLSERGLRRLGKWLHPDSDLHELIFDERPYKKYWVKCSKAVMPKGLCFEVNGKRVYKGEGTIEFTAYNPWAQEVSKNLSDEVYDRYDNKDEWAEASGLVENYPTVAQSIELDEFNSLDFSSGDYAPIYNPGEKDSDFVLEFDYVVEGLQTTNIEKSLLGSGYRLTGDNEVDSTKVYYVVYQNQLFELERDLGSWFIQDQDEYPRGYIDITGTYPIKFIGRNGDISGKVFDIYESADNIQWYVAESPLAETESYLIAPVVWATDGSQDGFLLLLNMNSSDEFVYFQFLDPPKTIPPALISIADLSNSIMRIGIKENLSEGFKSDYYFELTLPSVGTARITDWTEAQKLVGAQTGHIVIDTSKRVIKWCTIADSSLGTFTEYTGVAELITGGNWFKIPCKDDLLEENSSDPFEYFVIEYSNEAWFKIENEPTLTYHYMYK